MRALGSTGPKDWDRELGQDARVYIECIYIYISHIIQFPHWFIDVYWFIRLDMYIRTHVYAYMCKRMCKHMCMFLIYIYIYAHIRLFTCVYIMLPGKWERSMIRNSSFAFSSPGVRRHPLIRPNRPRVRWQSFLPAWLLPFLAIWEQYIYIYIYIRCIQYYG